MNKFCQFCDVASFKHQIIFGNKYFNVVYSRSPLAKGHIMIIPKRHINDFLDLTRNESISFFMSLKKASRLLKKAYSFDGVNLFANMGEKSGQIVPHLHFHLVPRYNCEKESPFSKLNNSESSSRRLTEKEIIANVEQLKKLIQQQ